MLHTHTRTPEILEWLRRKTTTPMNWKFVICTRQIHISSDWISSMVFVLRFRGRSENKNSRKYEKTLTWIFVELQICKHKEHSLTSTHWRNNAAWRLRTFDLIKKKNLIVFVYIERRLLNTCFTLSIVSIGRLFGMSTAYLCVWSVHRWKK